MPLITTVTVTLALIADSQRRCKGNFTFRLKISALPQEKMEVTLPADRAFLGLKSLTQEVIQLCENNGWEFETLSSCKNLASFSFPPLATEIQYSEQSWLPAALLSAFPDCQGSAIKLYHLLCSDLYSLVSSGEINLQNRDNAFLVCFGLVLELSLLNKKFVILSVVLNHMTGF